MKFKFQLLPKDALNDYFNWLPRAILGQLSEADQLMRDHSDGIIATAKLLSDTIQQPSQSIWRGVMLDPETKSEEGLEPRPQQTFESWTEIKDVAIWFATKDSGMNAPLKEMHPTYEGYIAKIKAHYLKDQTILWHYSWKEPIEQVLTQLTGPYSIDSIADLVSATNQDKPSLERVEFRKQAEWTLATQAEVILLPKDKHPYTPISNITDPILSTKELDSKYYPYYIQS